MLLKLDEKDKEVLNLLQARSSYSTISIREIFEHLAVHNVLMYLEKRPIYIPFLGNLEIDYQGDKIVKGSFTEAILDGKLTPSEFLKRTIGDIEDGNMTDLLTIFEKKIENEMNIKVDVDED
jgi:hypothetical protein